MAESNNSINQQSNYCSLEDRLTGRNPDEWLDAVSSTQSESATAPYTAAGPQFYIDGNEELYLSHEPMDPEDMMEYTPQSDRTDSTEECRSGEQRDSVRDVLNELQNMETEGVTSPVEIVEGINQVAPEANQVMGISQSSSQGADRQEPASLGSEVNQVMRISQSSSQHTDRQEPASLGSTENQSTATGSEGYNLPKYHDLEIDVNYRTVVKINKRTINNPAGFLLYCKRPMQGTERLEKIQLPFMKESDDTKAQKYTNGVLDAVDNGIHIYADLTTGRIYARRHCRCKVFYWSTLDHGKVDHTQEILREKDICIFDYQAYKTQLKNFVIQGQDEDKVKCPWNPAIVLSFAQNWNIRQQLNVNLVYAILYPLRAQYQLKWLQLQAGIEPKNVQEGFHSSLFLMSAS